MSNEVADLLYRLENSKDDKEYYENFLTFAKSLQIKNNTKADSWISLQARRRYRNFSDEEIEEFLKEPRANEKPLRELARYLENTSQIFQRLIGYLPSYGMSCVNSYTYRLRNY